MKSLIVMEDSLYGEAIVDLTAQGPTTYHEDQRETDRLMVYFAHTHFKDHRVIM
jgi:hypothetical protein